VNFIQVLFGFVAGLIFGLLVAWGILGLLVAGIGVAVMVIGSIAPTMFKAFFAVAVLGFLVSFIVSGGLSLL